MATKNRKKEKKISQPKVKGSSRDSVLQQFQGLNMDVNEMGLWPFAPRMVAYLIIAVVVLLLGWFLVLSSLNGRLGTVQLDERRLKEEYVEKLATANSLSLFKVELENTQNQVKLLEARLPTDANMASLLESISRAALSNQLNVKSLKAEALVVSQYYAEQPISIDLEGASYHDFGGFAESLAQLERIVTLDNITISPTNKETGEVLGSQGVQLKGTLKTYRYMDEAEQASHKQAAK